jgi:hypothetical protein
VSFAWSQAKQIAGEVYKLDVDDVLKERYATLFILTAASGLCCAELFALRINDLDFKAGTIRVDESADQRTYVIGPCKNVAAYRTILLADAECREALSILKRFLKGPQTQTSLVFRSKPGTALCETSVLHRFLHPVLRTRRVSSSWDACVSSRLQSQMGIVRDQSCRSPPTNGSQLCCDDGKIYSGKFRSTRCKRCFPRWNWKIWKLLENGGAVPAVA